MENGSKALIIAGAILLAILIIGLGVFIYNQAANTVSDTGMDQVAARQFNGQFEPYLNKTLGSSTVRALIDTIETNNRTRSNNVLIDGIDDKNELKLGHKYNTEPIYTDGVITGVIITDTNGSSSPGTLVDNNISESTDVFNARFNGLIDNGISMAQCQQLIDVVDSINSQYGDGTVTLSVIGNIDSAPCKGAEEWFDVTIDERYADGKIKIIYSEYHFSCPSEKK